jgi:hypothetical protein
VAWRQPATTRIATQAQQLEGQWAGLHVYCSIGTRGPVGDSAVGRLCSGLRPEQSGPDAAAAAAAADAAADDITHASVPLYRPASLSCPFRVCASARACFCPCAMSASPLAARPVADGVPHRSMSPSTTVTVTQNENNAASWHVRKHWNARIRARDDHPPASRLAHSRACSVVWRSVCLSLLWPCDCGARLFFRSSCGSRWSRWCPPLPCLWAT